VYNVAVQMLKIPTESRWKVEFFITLRAISSLVRANPFPLA